MNSDSDDPFDDLDDEALAALDAVEAAHAQSQAATANATRAAARSPTPEACPPTQVIEVHSGSDDDSWDFDESFIDRVYNGERFAGRGTVHTVQTTLDGRIAGASPLQQRARPMPKAGTFRKSKVWDHTAFAKTGSRKRKSAGQDGEQQDESLQLPAPFVPLGPPLPMKPSVDRLNAQKWYYPLNRSMRQYQRDIVEACLFENSLVAIPTGTGKTFIAGVIMLNYYRWFKNGKIIFLAPTKPLVAQQITACHEVCGIPGSDAAEMNGDIVASKRAVLWEKKRVFFTTPQTLQNDMTSENFDVRDVVLLVIDEAHRATGDYAYCTVVRHFMARNPHFRILALTATPSSDKDKIQPIVDSLHLSHIEIRSEASPDVKPYIKEKKLNKHVLTLPPNLAKVRDKLAKVMRTEMDKLKNGELYPNTDPVTASSFVFKLAADRSRGNKNSPDWAAAVLSNLQRLSQAMAFLLEYSPKMARDNLDAIANPSDELNRQTSKSGSGGRRAPPKYTKNPPYKELMAEFEKCHAAAPLVHPKMEKLRALLLDYFVAAEEDPEHTNSKAMVFVSYRACVEEIVEYLASDQPLIRPTKFVGQSGDAKGRKGLSQKEQKEIIGKFKSNEFNVLVSTSVGEEGLDIGEVDLIICYETPKGAIRNLQRAGRTGRQRSGRLDLLLTEGREEENWEKSKQKYEDVQQTIRAANLELYNDVERLLPDDIQPECEERVMEIVPYEDPAGNPSAVPARCTVTGDDFFEASQEEPQTKRASKKRKHDGNPKRNIPDSAADGFVSAGDLIDKPRKKRKTSNAKTNEPEMWSYEAVMADCDAVNEYAEEVSIGVDVQSTKGKGKAKTKATFQSKSKAKLSAASSASSSKTKAVPKKAPSKQQLSQTSSVIDITDTTLEDEEKWLLSDDSESYRSKKPRANSAVILNSPEDAPIASTSRHAFSPVYAPDRSGFRSARVIPRSAAEDRGNDSDVEMIVSQSKPIERTRSYDMMPPPSLPAQPTASPQIQPESPEFSQAIGVLGRRRLADVSQSPFDSPDFSKALAASGGKRLHRRRESLSPSSPLAFQPFGRSHDSSSTSPSRLRQNQRVRVRADPLRRAERNDLVDVLAEHSGDEEHAGDTSASDEEETSQDRLFVTEADATQADLSYDQEAAYRHGLFTQAPNGVNGPAFHRGPVRTHSHLNAREQQVMQANKRAAGVSSSPARPDGPLSDYEKDSFVVDDEDEIMYSSS